MKKLLFLLFTLAFTSATYAEKVTEQQALQKAQQFMQGKQFIQKKLRRAPSKNVESKAYYVFNVENNGGFVIVAGDDRMTEILGYSDTGNVNLDSIPEQMKWLLDGYQTIYRKLSTSTDNTPKARRTTRANVEPLLSTMWGQENPYNEMCPMYGTNRSITGCVATAMAQVINYCRWPEGQTASVPAYTTETYQLSVPALEPTQFYWEYMGTKQVARLMRYCGQSVKMDYGLAASGAALGRVPDALINIFGYSESARCVNSSSEFPDDTWENLLYEEIAAKRAVILSGVDSSRGGHAFVAHGYKDGLFCINWGWNGQQDGYFALTSLASVGGIYTFNQSAVIGIQPPGGIPITSRSIIKVSTDIFDWNTEWRTIYYQKKDDGSFPSFSVKEKIINTKQESIGVSIGYGLYGDQGLVEVLQQESHSFQADETYWHNATLAISNSVGDGEYYIVPISKDERATEWLPDIGSTSAFVKVIISGNLLKLTNYPLTSNEQREEYGIHTIDGITFELFNQMGSFRATVLPHKDGKYSGSITVPDEIEYDGIVFKVYNSCDISFKDCPELTSLSTSMIYGPSIVNCVKLLNLDFREGMKEFGSNGMISDCPLLEKIEYPATLNYIGFCPMNCNKLKVLAFKNPEKIEFAIFNISRYDLPSLTDVYFYSGEPPTLRWGDNGYTVTSDATIHIPQGTMALYKNSILKNCKLVEDLDTPFTGVNWSYCISDYCISDKSTDVFAEHCNTMNRNNIEFALHVPAEMISPYKNQRITSIQYYTPFNYTTDAPSYVFITKPGTDYLVKQATTETIEKQWTNVKLQEPLTITGDELYIGVGQLGHFCVYFTDPDVKEMDGIWMREMGPDRNGWLDLNPGKWWNQAERIPNWTHPIAVRFVIEGENFPNDLKICNVLGAEQDGKQVVKATIVNRSPELVKTYSINWTIDGKETGTKTVETSLIPNGHEGMILDLPSSVIATRSHVIKFEVTAINGKEDGVPANSNIEYSFSLPVSTTFSRRVVMEEVSGTWCGWTPVSIEAMKQMKNRYPDNFIAIAVHCDGENVSGTDQMANADNYLPILKKVQTIPGSLISRATSKYPNLPEVEAFANENKSNAVATMNLSVSTDAEDASKVIVKTDTRFGFNDEVEGRYRYAYVVLEDGVGPYVQSNNYYNQSEMSAPDDYLNAWTKLGDKVEMLHDNVARGIYPDINGVNGSVPASIKKGQSYNYEYTLTLPTNIQNKDNVRIAALLIDCWTGEIINAADCKIGESSKNIEIVPITETEEISFKDSMNDNTDLSNTVIDNTYFTVNAANGDGYDATEQAIVLNSTTTTEQMNMVQNAQVGDATMQANYNGIIFEVAGSGTVTVDAKTIGTHVLNVQIGNGEPTKTTKSERGTVDVPYNVTVPTYVYLYASSTAASGAPRRAAAENSVLLYSYKVNVTVDGIEMVTYGDQENAKWYTIDGLQLQGKPTKKGLYIVNGRKIIVK